MKGIDFLYELLRDRQDSQVFYNKMMINMINPVLRNLFRDFRDEDEKYVHKIRRQFLNIEASPMIFRAVFKK
ncbi:MAG: hypothetical protein ACOY31_01095 [Bacillota bacterium]